MNCPTGYDDSVVSCAQVASIKVLLSNPHPKALSVGYKLLENTVNTLNRRLDFYHLPVGVANEQAALNLFNQLTAMTKQLPQLSLHYLGFIAASSDISLCTDNGYLQHSTNKAVMVVDHLVQQIIHHWGGA